MAKTSAKKPSTKVQKTVVKPAKKQQQIKNKFATKVTDDKIFFVIDGTTLSNLIELVEAFDRMSDDVYYHHVTSDRNDFAIWVADALKMQDLADKLRNAHGPMHAQTIVLKYMLNW
ncbi:MAG: hypothetical protein QW594_02070 [Candidatus Woesearchaeota archaeon]